MLGCNQRDQMDRAPAWLVSGLLQVTDGGCEVQLDDQAEKQSYAAGTYFDVPAKSGFTIVVGEGICQYVCSFLS